MLALTELPDFNLADEIVIHELCFHSDYQRDPEDSDDITEIMLASDCIAYYRYADGSTWRAQLTPGQFIRVPHTEHTIDEREAIQASVKQIYESFPDYSRDVVNARMRGALLMASVLGTTSRDR